MPPNSRRPGSPSVFTAQPQPRPADAILTAFRAPSDFAALATEQARLRPALGLAIQPPQNRPPSTPPVRPRSARDAYEIGLTCAAMDEADDALAAFREATSLDQAFLPAWHGIAQILHQAGDISGASAARQKAGPAANAVQSLSAKRVPPEKIAATERNLRQSMKGASRDSADFTLRERLKAAPTDVAAMHLLATSLSAQGLMRAAEQLLHRAVGLAPDYRPVRHAYAICLGDQGKHALALPHAEWLVAQDPRAASYRALLGACLAGIGQFARAAVLYARLVAEMPESADLWSSYGSALLSVGRRDEAVQAYRTCLKLGARVGEAYWTLASALRGALPPDAIADIERHLAGTDLRSLDRSLLHYALGRVLEQGGDYAASFAHYEAGAKARRSIIDYCADDMESLSRRTQDFFTAEVFASRAGWGCADPAPVFIIGMPRAGSTLIEQILASHSAVEGTMELSEISHILAQFSVSLSSGDGDALARLASLGPEDLKALGQQYIDRTRIYRQTSKPFFIDKMPANWAYAGLIKLILPNAKIIDARRDPMGNCFGAFKQSFLEGQAFSYDLTELGRYYRTYVGMMSHMDRVLPGSIHRVMYEDLVADTESQVRRLLDYCGLEFEEACLRFWDNGRAVSTISVDQVRRPIYRDSVDLWRHYAPWLTPLRQALGLESPGP